MDKALFNSIILIVFGGALILFNKPFGRACQFWQNDILKNDYPLWSFRLPILIVGSLLSAIGSFYFILK